MLDVVDRRGQCPLLRINHALLNLVGAQTIVLPEMLTTGMLITGKISVGVRSNTNGLNKINSNATTINVYGRPGPGRQDPQPVY